MQCVLRAIYREVMWPKRGAVSSHPIHLHGLVLKKLDNQITAGFSDLLQAAQNNTHAYVHRTEKSTKLTHTLKLNDSKDFFRGVLKFNTLCFRNRTGPCLGARVFQNKSYCIIIIYTVIKHGLESN
jgi:hypothetical protein